MLAKIVSFMESNAVVKVLELLAGLFAGQGASAGGDQPPAFVAGDVARCGFQDGKLWPKNVVHLLVQASSQEFRLNDWAMHYP